MVRHNNYTVFNPVPEMISMSSFKTILRHLHTITAGVGVAYFQTGGTVESLSQATENSEEAAQLRDAAWRLYESGRAELSQKRMDDGTVLYLAMGI